MGIETVEPSFAERIEKALDEIRPYLHSHGGDIHMVSFKDAQLFVQFKGTCAGCPISLYTLKLGVEQKLKERFPEVKEVIAID